MGVSKRCMLEVTVPVAAGVRACHCAGRRYQHKHRRHADANDDGFYLAPHGLTSLPLETLQLAKDISMVLQAPHISP
jgi:hypothetical protein